MDLDYFPGHNVVYAKDQPEYRPLPAYAWPDDARGRLTCCWELTWKERLRVLFTGRIWHTMLSFGQLLQPQLLETERPEGIPYSEANYTL